MQWFFGVAVLVVASVAPGCTVRDASEPSAGKSSSGGASANATEGGATEKVDGDKSTGDKPTAKFTGKVTITGSSTVYPISQAMGEEFMNLHKGVDVSVGESGTGPGMKELGEGKLDIADASRPIKPAEAEACKASGVEYIELKVAIDGLSVVVNPQNDWCNAISVAQLKALWSPDSKIKKWKELDASWPDEEIRLYGADHASGTFDYFTEAIVGKSKSSRTDYTPSTDDNVLVKGVTGDKYALGYFGYAYYAENKSKLKVLPIAAGDDLAAAVAPTDETILGGTYKPLSRPLYIYVNKASLKKPQVAEFVNYYLHDGQSLVKSVRYVQLPAAELDAARKTLSDALSN
ncbi:MAG: PstS family phosphate ABC transporter substrate-binding protein [Planctomycetaceae bacterium]